MYRLFIGHIEQLDLTHCTGRIRQDHNNETFEFKWNKNSLIGKKIKKAFSDEYLTILTINSLYVEKIRAAMEIVDV